MSLIEEQRHANESKRGRELQENICIHGQGVDKRLGFLNIDTSVNETSYQFER
jgi:hypothetical protein